MNTTIIITLIIFSYLLGSISSAILISQFNNLPDPRSYGSKNPGATNILRKFGIKIATSVIIFDVLKGMIPIWIGCSTPNISQKVITTLAIVVYLGHIYPIFFRFKGGKGVATAFGSLTAISVDISVIMITTWLITVMISRYSSLGAICTSIITSIYIWWIHPKFTLLAIILSSLILIRHRSNIIRLYQHKEKQFWKRKNK